MLSGGSISTEVFITLHRLHLSDLNFADAKLFYTNYPFLYPLKPSETLKGFQGL